MVELVDEATTPATFSGTVVDVGREGATIEVIAGAPAPSLVSGVTRKV
jgi:hypothetical protein